MGKVKVRQSCQLRETDWWDWEVWLDGSDRDLDTIEEVKYRLHPTFPNPTRVIRDRSSKFILRAAGWGEFTILIEIHYRDGRVERRSHALKLEQEDGGGSGPAKELRVFISYSLADGRIASALKEHLERLGLEVSSAQEMIELESSRDLVSQLKTLIAGSDALVAILSDATSSWVEEERVYAASVGIPTFSVILGNWRHPFRGRFKSDVFRLADSSDFSGLVRQIGKRIGKSLEVPPPTPKKARGGSASRKRKVKASRS